MPQTPRKPREQLCLVKQVAQHQTGEPYREHAKVIGIQLCLIEYSTHCLKRFGCSCFQILVRERYLEEDQESHEAHKDGVHDPGTEVAECDALAESLQDREHQDPVSGVTSDGSQPQKCAER